MSRLGLNLECSDFLKCLTIYINNRAHYKNSLKSPLTVLKPRRIAGLKLIGDGTVDG